MSDNDNGCLSLSHTEVDETENGVVSAIATTSTTESESAVENDDEEIESDGAFGKLLKKLSKKICNHGIDNETEGDRLPIHERYYSMSHENRGLAIIFNHEKYDSGLSARTGTKEDGFQVQKVFKKLGFKICYSMNPSYGDIEHVIKTKVLAVNHSTSDCIAFVIMTHGQDHDVLHAKDRSYNLDKMICKKLTADKCPSLAGKPKLFFIQACRGEKFDSGTEFVSTDSPEASAYSNRNIVFKIPNEADFFLAFSTVPGYVALRNTIDGSWFIQALCYTLKKESSWDTSIFEIMTEVAGNVAFTYISDSGRHKQIPSFTSRLTKNLIFGHKHENGNTGQVSVEGIVDETNELNLSNA